MTIKNKEYESNKKLKKSYYDRKLCTSCVLPNPEWPNVICKRCQRIRYLALRIPDVVKWIEHYKLLLPRLKAERKELIRQRNEERNGLSSGRTRRSG